MYEIEIGESAFVELDKLRTSDTRRLIDEIETQLTHQPTVVTRRRKELVGLVPPFDAVPPIWQLSVGEYRVFYDVSEEERKVYVRAIRQKPPHKTTEEIL